MTKARKKKSGPTKTTQFLKILHFVATSKQKCISEDQLVEFLGNPSRAKLHRDIDELTLGTADFPGFLVKTKNEETGKKAFCFNHEGWQAFLDLRTDGAYLLECYRQTGYLLDSNFSNMVFKLDPEEKIEVKDISRKFLHLVKVKAQRTKASKDILNTIIEAIVQQKQVEITYEGGVRILRPYTLLSHRDELYIMGDRRKGDSIWEPRTYKLTRISKIKKLTIRFNYPTKNDWDPLKYFEKSSGLMIGEPKQVRIKVYGHSKKIIAEKDFFNASLTNRDEDCDTYLVTYSHKNEFIGALFVYAQDIEIVDDDELRKAFIEKAQQALIRNSVPTKRLA